jgi:hypothetical protein
MANVDTTSITPILIERREAISLAAIAIRMPSICLLILWRARFLTNFRCHDNDKWRSCSPNFSARLYPSQVVPQVRFASGRGIRTYYFFG